jgi:hypothetical protein
MKNLLLILGCCFLSIAVQAQKVNEKVQIESSGIWYNGVILKVNADEGKYFIKYDDYGDSWNEWVGIERLKGFGTKQAAAPEPAKAPLTKFKVGDRVEVEYGMIPEPATVIEVGENKYHIQYDKKSFGSKWVTEKQIKKL